VECQSHRLTVEDPVTVEYITRYIASLKQVWWATRGGLKVCPDEQRFRLSVCRVCPGLVRRSW